LLIKGFYIIIHGDSSAHIGRAANHHRTYHLRLVSIFHANNSVLAGIGWLVLAIVGYSTYMSGSFVFYNAQAINWTTHASLTPCLRRIVHTKTHPI
jgi:hypothetical protein